MSRYLQYESVLNPYSRETVDVPHVREEDGVVERDAMKAEVGEKLKVLVARARKEEPSDVYQIPEYVKKAAAAARGELSHAAVCSNPVVEYIGPAT